MDTWLLQAFNALSLSSILLLIGIGLAFTFGLMGVINMAHGEFIMVGAYVTYLLQVWCSRWLGDLGTSLYFPLAIIVSFLVAAAAGYLLESAVIRFLYGRPLDTLLATWGVSLVLQQVARDVFGAPNVQIVSPAWLVGGLRVAGVLLPYKRLLIIGLVAAAVAGVHLLLTRTGAGRRIRAVMQNRSVAACMGIPTRRVDAATFALGSGLAGVAGCALALLGPIGPSLGTYYIVDAFMVVVLGGIGQLAGTVTAAGIIGTLNSVLEFSTTASIGKVLVLALIIAFLQWKPGGLFAMRSRSLE